MNPETFTPSGTEVYTEERCYIVELYGVARDPTLSVARARVTPGVTTAWHRLSVDERYLIEEGGGEVEVGDTPPRRVGPGDIVVIPAEVRQRITNTGTADLVFLCLCTPAFTPDVYEHLE